MADLKNLAAKNWYNGKVVYDWIALEDGVGSMAAGYKWAESNCVICIRLELPAAAKSITLSFCNGQGGYTGNKNLRYKITGNEDVSLENATSAIPGDGDFTLTGGDWARNSVTIQQNLSAGTHYLYIWTNDSNKTGNVMWVQWITGGKYGFIGTYEEMDNFSWIKDGGEVKPYLAAIRTGEGVKIHAPYVFVQGEWKALN